MYIITLYSGLRNTYFSIIMVMCVIHRVVSKWRTYTIYIEWLQAIFSFSFSDDEENSSINHLRPTCLLLCRVNYNRDYLKAYRSGELVKWWALLTCDMSRPSSRCLPYCTASCSSLAKPQFISQRTRQEPRNTPRYVRIRHLK